MLAPVSSPVVEYAAIPDIHQDTLGLAAVQDAHTDAGWIELGSVREQLRDMHHDRAEMFDKFCRMAVPLDLRAEKDHEDPDSLWNAWLFRGTGDQQLLDFLKWNVDSIRRQQADPRFQEIVAAQRERFKAGVAQGLVEGWLHSDFEAAIYGVDDLQVYVGDGFNTHAKGYDGYHKRGTKDVVIAGARRLLGTPLSDLYERTSRAAGHEFNHPFGKLSFRMMDEALTEHLNQSYAYGQPHIIRPSDREHGDKQAYTAEGALMADFLGPVAVRFASLAYSRAEGIGREDEFASEVNAYWAPFVPAGHTAFDQLRGLVVGLESQYQREEGMLPIAAGRRVANEVRQLLARDPSAVFAVHDSAEQFKSLLAQAQ